MSNDFDTYLSKLQKFEQDENRSTLSSFCTMNKTVLSYFKGIWEPINNVIKSSNVDAGIVADIKSALPVLSQLKDEFESLKDGVHGGDDEVLRFQSRIDSLTCTTCHAVLHDLQTLKSRMSRPDESGERINSGGSVMDGHFSSQEDLLFAEKHLEEGDNKSFFINLVNNTQKAGVLNRIFRHVSKNFPLNSKERKEIMYSLVRKDLSFERRHAAVAELIKSANTKVALMEFLNYIPHPKDTWTFPYGEWIDRMKIVAGIDEDAIWKLINDKEHLLYPDEYASSQTPGKSEKSGCLSVVLLIIALSGLSCFGFI